MSDSREIKLLHAKSAFLRTKSEITKEVFEEAKVCFRAALHESCEIEIVNPKPPPPSGEEEISEPKQEDIEKKPEKDSPLKGIYRKIALRTHPDKFVSAPDSETETAQKLFLKAQKALEEEDYYAMIEIANELKIDYPEATKEQINMMRVKIEELQKQVDEIEDSVPWAWYHGDDKTKGLIMDKYIELLRQMHGAGP